jgi:hypothetical protein
MAWRAPARCEFADGASNERKLPSYSATVVIQDNCKPRFSRWLSGIAYEQDIEKRVICLPDGVCPICFATVNQIESLSVGFRSFMREH